MRIVVVPVEVNPGWRICYRGRVYESGRRQEIDIDTASQWSAWGSVTPLAGAGRVVESETGEEIS